MDIKLLFFGEASELAGKSEDFVSLPESVSYENAKSKIFEKFPELLKIEKCSILAVDQEYSSPGTILKLTRFSEIAIIPPISGG